MKKLDTAQKVIDRCLFPLLKMKPNFAAATAEETEIQITNTKLKETYLVLKGGTLSVELYLDNLYQATKHIHEGETQYDLYFTTSSITNGSLCLSFKEDRVFVLVIDCDNADEIISGEMLK